MVIAIFNIEEVVLKAVFTLDDALADLGLHLQSFGVEGVEHGFHCVH